jgi:DNA-binding response OmpR family regulator
MDEQQSNELTLQGVSAPRGCVLIVNADRTFAGVLKAYLQQQNWSALVCSAREAVRDFPQLRPRALILDFDGGGLDAYDVLGALPADCAPTQVLVCSQHAEPTAPDRDSLRELGMTHWLRRPCSLDTIARALDEVCGPVELPSRA